MRADEYIKYVSTNIINIIISLYMYILKKAKVTEVLKHSNLKQKFKSIKLKNNKDEIKLIAMQIITSFIYKKIKHYKKKLNEKNIEELKKNRVELKSRRIIIKFLRNVCMNYIKNKLKIKLKLYEKYMNACIKIQLLFRKFISFKKIFKMKLNYFHTQMFLITINNLSTNILNSNSSKSSNNSSSYGKEKYNIYISSICSDNGRNHVELTNDQLSWLLVPSSLSLLSKKYQPKSILFQSSLHHISYSEINHLIINNNNLALPPNHNFASHNIQPIFQSKIIFLYIDIAFIRFPSFIYLYRII